MANQKIKVRQLTEDEKTIVKKTFQLFDTEKKNYLNYSETKAAIRALGFQIKKLQLLSIMKACDKNNENKMNFQDFYYVMADKLAKRDPIDEIKYAYKLFSEESSSGKIAFHDLENINKKIGCKLSEEEMHAMIEEFDTDQDGFINEAEFIEIMTNSTI